MNVKCSQSGFRTSDSDSSESGGLLRRIRHPQLQKIWIPFSSRSGSLYHHVLITTYMQVKNPLCTAQFCGRNLPVTCSCQPIGNRAGVQFRNPLPKKREGARAGEEAPGPGRGPPCKLPKPSPRRSPGRVCHSSSSFEATAPYDTHMHATGSAFRVSPVHAQAGPIDSDW